MTSKEINKKIVAILFPANEGQFGVSDALLKKADFCGDLNAMWYAECKLDWEEIKIYSDALRKITTGGDYVAHMDRRFHATALERALIFIEVKERLS